MQARQLADTGRHATVRVVDLFEAGFRFSDCKFNQFDDLRGMGTGQLPPQHVRKLEQPFSENVRFVPAQRPRHAGHLPDGGAQARDVARIHGTGVEQQPVAQRSVALCRVEQQAAQRVLVERLQMITNQLRVSLALRRGRAGVATAS